MALSYAEASVALNKALDEANKRMISASDVATRRAWREAGDAILEELSELTLQKLSRSSADYAVQTQKLNVAKDELKSIADILATFGRVSDVLRQIAGKL